MKKMMGFVCMAVVVTACSSAGGSTSGAGTSDATSKAAGTSKPAGSGASAAKAPDSGDLKWVKLEKANNIQMQVDPDAVVSDGVGSGNMVMSTVAPVSVKVAGDNDPKTVDDYKKSVTDFTPKNWKTDKLADGWWATWENTGSAGTNYWLSVYRTIDKKAYVCDTSLDSDAKRDAALKSCKTLKP